MSHRIPQCPSPEPPLNLKHLEHNDNAAAHPWVQASQARAAIFIMPTPDTQLEVGLNNCSQNGGELYKDAYYNLKPNTRTRFAMSSRNYPKCSHETKKGSHKVSRPCHGRNCLWKASSP